MLGGFVNTAVYTQHCQQVPSGMRHPCMACNKLQQFNSLSLEHHYHHAPVKSLERYRQSREKYEGRIKEFSWKKQTLMKNVVMNL